METKPRQPFLSAVRSAASSPWARAALVFLLAMSFMALPLHHHTDGDEALSCSVCHLVKTFAAAAILVFCLFLRAVPPAFMPVWILGKLQNPFFLSPHSRAPPAC